MTLERACSRLPPGRSCALCSKGEGRLWYCPPSEGEEGATLGGDAKPLVEGYQVLRQLGKGGMGTVLLVQAAEGAVLAMKVMPARGVGERQVRRFQREAMVLARLDIDGVVRVHDSGLNHRVHWFTMDWVRGVTLDEVLRSRRGLARDEAIRIVTSVATSLHAVHERGLAHRDIKPSNILIGEDGEVVLVDFGLLRPLEDGGHTPLTRAPVGTPAYMAPELLKSTEIDWVRADVFSLGAVLARCITGELARGPWDVTDADPAGEAARRALAARPEERPASAIAFANLLNEPIRPPTHAAVRTLAALGFAVLLGAGMWSLRGPEVQGPDLLQPVRALYRAGELDEADRLFRDVVLEVDPSAAPSLWLQRAELWNTPEAWASAWDRLEGDPRQRALVGLVGALHEAGDFEALDMLFATHADRLDQLDPTGRIRVELDVFRLRLDEAWPRLTSHERDVLAAFRDPTAWVPGIYDRWSCIDQTCTRKGSPDWSLDRGFWAVDSTDGTSWAWTDGEILEVGGDRRCSVPPERKPFASSAVGNVGFLAATGQFPGLVVIDFDTCAIRQVEDQAQWDGSYVLRTIPWDVDHDGTHEVAVMIAAPSEYAMHVYDLDGTLRGRLRVGSVGDAFPWGDDLALLTVESHGSADLFDDIPPVGLHRVRWTDEGPRIVWSRADDDLRNLTVLDDTLLVSGHDGQVRVFVDPEQDPLRLGDLSAVFEVQGLVQTARREQPVVFGGPGPSIELAAPAPEPPVATGDLAIDRARGLESIGMTTLAAQRLADRSHGSSGAEGKARWAEVGRLWAADGHLTEAAEALARVTTIDPPDGFEAALRAALAAGDLQRAKTLQPDAPVSEPVQAALDSHQVVDFSERPSDWRLQPGHTSWYTDQQLLHLRGQGDAGPLARLGLRRTSPFAGFRVRFHTNRVEFASAWELGLFDADGGQSATRLEVRGSQGRLRAAVTPFPWAVRTFETTSPTESHTYEVVYALDGTRLYYELHRDGVREARYEADRSTIADLLAFEVRSLGTVAARTAIDLDRIELWGLAPAPSAPLPAVPARVARIEAIRRGAEPTVDEALTAFAIPWRLHRNASGLADAIQSVPVPDDVATTHPVWALLLADVRLTTGDPEGAEALIAAVDPSVSCVRRGTLRVAAAVARADEATERLARQELDACDATPSELRTMRWSLGL